MMKGIAKYIMVSLMLLPLGCSRPGNGSFSSFTSLPESGWVYGDSIEIMAVGLDSVGERKLTIGVCHSDEFLYRNLWLEISYRDRRDSLVRDSINIAMADDHGRWLGKGLGASYQCEVPLPDQADIADSTRIAVRHIMRLDTLRGISKIGIGVENI